MQYYFKSPESVGSNLLVKLGYYFKSTSCARNVMRQFCWRNCTAADITLAFEIYPGDLFWETAAHRDVCLALCNTRKEIKNSNSSCWAVSKWSCNFQNPASVCIGWGCILKNLNSSLSLLFFISLPLADVLSRIFKVIYIFFGRGLLGGSGIVGPRPGKNIIRYPKVQRTRLTHHEIIS